MDITQASGAWGRGSIPLGGTAGERRPPALAFSASVCLIWGSWRPPDRAGSVRREEADGVSQMPEVSRRGLDPALRLRTGRRGRHLQGVGLLRSRVWLLPPRRQGGSHLRQEDRAEAVSFEPSPSRDNTSFSPA